MSEKHIHRVVSGGVQGVTYLYQTVLGIHIVLAITWVGGILFIGWGVYPSFRELQPTVQRTLYSSLMRRIHWIFAIEGVGVISTGTVLGVIWGPIKTWQELVTTRFGHIWSMAFCIAVLTLLWGAFVSYPFAMRQFSKEMLWADGVNAARLRNKVMRHISVIESVEVVGFLVLVGCMILFVT